jgi:hypothetical protein
MNESTFSYLSNGTYVRDIPGGYIELPRPDESSPTQTERDAARWLALVTLRKDLRPEWRLVPCASCENVNAEWCGAFLDVRIAAVVPWDVMGDPRSFAFVCDECASGSVVVL